MKIVSAIKKGLDFLKKVETLIKWFSVLNKTIDSFYGNYKEVFGKEFGSDTDSDIT